MSQVQPSEHNTDDSESSLKSQSEAQPLPPQQSLSPRHISKVLKPLSLVSLGIVIGLILGILLSVSFIKQTTAKSLIRLPQPQAAQSLAIGSIGKPLTIALWQVTVNSVKTSLGDKAFAPHAGNKFLIVDVTVLNDSSDPQIISSGLMFILKDSTGQAYNETITDIGKPLDGTIQSIDKLRGQIVYEVPAGEHSFTFQFQDSTYYANVGKWSFNV